jgi:sigma-B regulation protein RsbU (phosphoserine phosphatase)
MRHLLWLTLAAQLSGQVIRVTNLDSATPLNGEWRQQVGDDPRYADPGFDDSSWSRVTMPKAIVPGTYGYTWHRIHLELPTTDRPLAIAVAPHFSAYEIFANGVKIGSFGGALSSVFGQHFARMASFTMPKAEAHVVIAIRSAEWNLSLGVPTGSSLVGTSWVGPPDAIDLKVAAAHIALLEGSGWHRMLCTGLGFGGLFFVMLGLSRLRDREFLWCGLLLLAAMMNRLYQIPEVLQLDSRMVASLLNFATQSCFVVSWVLLLSSLFHRRATFWVWLTAGSLIGGQFLLTFEAWSEWMRIHSAQTRLLGTSLYIPLLPLTYYLLGWYRRQPSRPEWFTHVTLIIYVATNSIQNGVGFLFPELGQLSSQGGGMQVTYTLVRSPILLMFFAMGLVLSKRKAETEREQARLQQELSAAAQVQTLLLPGVATEGVEATYLPASEVGGDFYQAFQTHDKATIALVGDVSGKGLKAAMLVSVAIGAIEREQSLRPEEILDRLNLALIGRTGGGFVTCCCVRIEASGRSWVASAGHPSPYLHGQEIQFEAGLPLGVVREAAYQSHEFQLQPGDQLTMVSDGVLEAENEAGELFGFERTRTISNQSAIEIAQAAREWGQNDDITVVTIRRNG